MPRRDPSRSAGTLARRRETRRVDRERGLACPPHNTYTRGAKRSSASTDLTPALDSTARSLPHSALVERDMLSHTNSELRRNLERVPRLEENQPPLRASPNHKMPSPGRVLREHRISSR